MAKQLTNKKYTADNVKLTQEDIRNGWTVPKLVDYLNEREEQAAVYVLQEKPKEHKVENIKTTHFNPHNWQP